MAEQTVELSQHEVSLINKLVEDGVYADAGDALRDGLRRIEQEHQAYAAKLDTLRHEVQKGFDDLDQGRYTELHGREELHAHIARLGEQAAERAAARGR